jgi:hypothetical protein
MKSYKLQNTNYKLQTRGTLFEILKRTVIGHWSFVIGEKNNTKKHTLIGWGCQPPVPLDPPQKLFIKVSVTSVISVAKNNWWQS